MKFNHNIDFFSSPSSKFIGLADIRHPQLQINPHHNIDIPYQNHFDSKDKKNCARKLSFNSHNIQPIQPFDQDFFQQKLQQCQEPSSYSNLLQHHNQQDQMMIETNFKTPCKIQKPFQKIKQPLFQYTENMMKVQQQSIIQQVQKNKQMRNIQKPLPKIQLNDQNYMTPKRKTQLSFSNRKFCQSTSQKTASRNNQKGLRRLSSLAYAIVSQSSTTTYKQVAQKLLIYLNFVPANQIDDQDGVEKSSMQNIKRRVYDSLNVLLALGVIKRVGSKIARQKQKKPFSSPQSLPDFQRYNELLQNYNMRIKALQAKKRTERQLKQKLSIFKKTIERNKKTKSILKNKIIKLPFVAFVSNQQGKLEWIKKQVEVNNENIERKKTPKRNASDQNRQKQNELNKDMIVRATFKGYPQSYGDLDFFKLIQQEPESLIKMQIQEEYEQQIKQSQIQKKGKQMNKKQHEMQIEAENNMKGALEQYEQDRQIDRFSLIKRGNDIMMNLIDQVMED